MKITDDFYRFNMLVSKRLEQIWRSELINNLLSFCCAILLILGAMYFGSLLFPTKQEAAAVSTTYEPSVPTVPTRVVEITCETPGKSQPAQMAHADPEQCPSFYGEAGKVKIDMAEEYHGLLCRALKLEKQAPKIVEYERLRGWMEEFSTSSTRKQSDKQLYSSWKLEAKILKEDFNKLASEYNTRMAGLGCPFGDTDKIPAGEIFPLPCEFRLYNIENP